VKVKNKRPFLWGNGQKQEKPNPSANWTWFCIVLRCCPKERFRSVYDALDSLTKPANGPQIGVDPPEIKPPRYLRVNIWTSCSSASCARFRPFLTLVR